MKSHRVVDKVRPVRRSAGFQPAVSPISNRQNVAVTVAPRLSGNPQAGSTAIQQVGNLRYDVVHGPVKSDMLHRLCFDMRLRFFAAIGFAALLAASGTSMATSTNDSSRDYRVDVWKSDQGPPQNNVQCILQPRDGCLWIGNLLRDRAL